MSSFDDRTLPSIFAREGEQPMVETLWHATLKPEVSCIEELMPHVLACFATREQGINAMIACDEIFANIALYSGATSVDVEIRQTGREVLVEFADDGVPFDPLTARPIERDVEDYDKGGMGIMIVKQICSDIDYERSGGKNILTLHFCRRADDPAPQVEPA